MPIFIFPAEDTLAKRKLAELLRDLRGDDTQRQFAKRLETSYTSIQDWEKQVRLPSEKNLQRIAQLKGWTYFELVLFLFERDAQSAIATTDPLEIIMACLPKLSPSQRQQLEDCLKPRAAEISRADSALENYWLNDSEKHNLHLLLRASLKQQDPLEAMERAKIDPELFADVFLKREGSREIGFEQLKQIGLLCCRVIRWRGDQLPEVDPCQNYRGQIGSLLRDLRDGSREQQMIKRERARESFPSIIYDGYTS